MFFKKKILVIIIFLLYQTSSSSKSTSFNNLDSKNLSKYFSGIVAFENKNVSKALSFFNSSKILVNEHNPFLERYIFSLVLENKISQAINLIQQNEGKANSNFFDAHLLLIIKNLKINDFNQAYFHLSKALNSVKKDKFDQAILETLEQYIFVFWATSLVSKIFVYRLVFFSFFCFFPEPPPINLDKK